MATTHLCTLPTSSVKWILFTAIRTLYGCLCLCSWLSCSSFPLSPTILWRSCCVPSLPISLHDWRNHLWSFLLFQILLCYSQIINKNWNHWYTFSPNWSQLLRIRKNDSVLSSILSYIFRCLINAYCSWQWKSPVSKCI